MLISAIAGHAVTVLAHGPRNGGKTYSLFGSPLRQNSNEPGPDDGLVAGFLHQVSDLHHVVFLCQTSCISRLYSSSVCLFCPLALVLGLAVVTGGDRWTDRNKSCIYHLGFCVGEGQRSFEQDFRHRLDGAREQ